MKTQILDNLGASVKNYSGLTREESARLLAVYGFNSRPQGKKKTWLGRIKNIFTEPMMLLILITALVYYFIGELSESLIFFGAIVPIAIMEYLQEKRTDEAVEALDNMITDQAKVYRDGHLIDENVQNLVPGDLLYLTAGDKVPADGYLLRSPGLSLDESVLTGESNPVTKDEILADSRAGEKNILRKGTLVIQGEGDFLVESTGLDTEYGRLGELLSGIIKEKTPLQKKIYVLVRGIAVVAIAVALLVVFFLSFSLGWREGVLGGLAIAMSLIPEEIPIVFSIFLIMGVWRMARKNALVRHMAMVETLGSATVICTDKTGTLTEGRMSLEKIYFQKRIIPLTNKKNKSEVLSPFIKSALLSFERHAVDPMEIEIQNFAGRFGWQVENFFDDFEILKSSPFNADDKMVHHIWRDKKTNAATQYSVGAPESIMNICDFTDADKKSAEAAFMKLSRDGYRVVGLATGKCQKKMMISSRGLAFVGLVAMSDPLRAGVPEAIKMCQEAGIRIIMITGDNKLVARHIADRAGLRYSSQGILDSGDLDKLSPAALKKAVMEHNVFVRVRPNHKFAIVAALQENSEIVAMTGDGVNDAPALKKADIGIAMGRKGTEVAREAAGIILLDDNFATIVEAVKQGRRIYNNMRQAFVFLISFHLPIIGLAVTPLLFHQSLIFLPIHIVFLELICDPVSVLGFQRDKLPYGAMKVPPRPIKEPIISRALWLRSIIQGLGIFFISFIFYYYFGLKNGDVILGRTTAFTALIFSQIILIFLTREWLQIKSNRFLVGISLSTIFGLTLILFIPALNKIFHFIGISWQIYVLILILSFLAMLFTAILATGKRKIYV